MKLTLKQQKELQVIKYYIPSNCVFSEVTDSDIARFFAWSDKGIGKDSIATEAMQTNTGLAALYWGKQRRDLQITSYLEDWGTYITATDLAEEPEYIAEYLSKRMKKPGIYTMWELFNAKERLTDQDMQILEPLKKLTELAA